MKPSPRFSRSFLLTALGLVACRATDGEVPPTWPPVVEAQMGTMEICSSSDELWFGSSPGADDLRLAGRRGFQRVIDLGCEAGAELAPLAAELGMSWDVVPVLDAGRLRDGEVDRVLDLLGVAPDVRTLMICDDGAVSAALFAIHRVVQGGMSLDEALVEARRAGLRSRPGATDVGAQIERLRSTP